MGDGDIGLAPARLPHEPVERRSLKKAPGLTRKRIALAAAAVLLAWGAFAFGVVSELRLGRDVAIDSRLPNLRGDGTPEVRMGVLKALRIFQDGYRNRDSKQLNSFMRDLFPENDDILLMGTNPGEWVRGYRDIGKFIQQDWENWGDFRFAVDDSSVWSSGDVAWVVSPGTVRERGAERRVRFSAILKRIDDRWRFRQVQFQWDDPGARLSDLLHPKTHIRLAGLLSEYLPSMVRQHLW